ncbi:hypothetical protein BS78_06G058400 [Paspalum vaginatum]|nr:hypothetical protein BS78_06G058400 [Paspalum vaginatum]
MSKNQAPCTAPCCRRAAKRFKRLKKHLYLIVDDWERGYNIYQIDSLPLPGPPVVRFKARHGGSWYFATHGAKILATQPSGCPAFPVFDIQTTALTVCPWSRRGGNKVQQKPFFPSVSGSLYLLRDGGHFDVLGATPPPLDVCSPPPFDDPNRISSFAVHPDGDGRTLFVTVNQEWASHGDWFMPFQGEAFYDGELDAWNLGKDQLFDAESRRHLGAKLVYMGDGDTNITKYCLIESLAHDNEEDLRRLHWDGYYPHGHVLSVTTFGLKYDKQGHLVTTHRKVQSFEVTDAHKLPELSWNPVAFWM